MLVILSILYLLFLDLKTIPWVGLLVAILWSVYNLLRKKINVNTDINSCDGGEVEIGNDVMIGRNVYIRASDHIFKNTDKKIRQSGYDSGKIKIENNVWIGSNCIIMKNVTIEEGSVIESGSVVKKSVGKNEFVTSNEQTNKKY